VGMDADSRNACRQFKGCRGSAEKDFVTGLRSARSALVVIGLALLVAAFAAPQASAAGLGADIGVTLTVTNATPNLGDTITFTATVSNAGPSPATGVSVQDKLPTGLTFVSATPSQGTYSSSTGVWAGGTMLSGASQTLTIQAKVASPAPLTDTATGSSNATDPNSANNTASITETPQQADLNLAQTVSNTGPNPGDADVFTVTLRNKGPNPATNVTVTDLVPSGLTLVSATPATGTTYDSTTGVWTVGTVKPGTPEVLRLQTTYTGPGAVENTSSVTHSDQFDPDTTNNNVSETVPVTRTQTTVSSSVNPSAPGQAVTFTATVSPVPDGGMVRFAIDGSFVGDPVPVDSSGQATLPATSSLAVGSHKVVANYSGDANFVAGRSPTLIQVVKNPTPPVVVKPTVPAKPTVPTAPPVPPAPKPGARQRLVSISGLAIHPGTFAASTSGPSARDAATHGAGATVAYKLNLAARVRFTVARLLPGRRAAGGRCVKQSSRSRHAHACLRVVALPGGFTVSGKPGRDSFTFTGRLSGHKLGAGSYELIATPTAGGRTGHSGHTDFRIVVKRASAR
jgi:uncharacterized repeat protein (TIGR01451 family)